MAGESKTCDVIRGKALYNNFDWLKFHAQFCKHCVQSLYFLDFCQIYPCSSIRLTLYEGNIITINCSKTLSKKILVYNCRTVEENLATCQLGHTNETLTYQYIVANGVVLLANGQFGTRSAGAKTCQIELLIYKCPDVCISS